MNGGAIRKAANAGGEPETAAQLRGRHDFDSAQRGQRGRNLRVAVLFRLRDSPLAVFRQSPRNSLVPLKIGFQSRQNLFLALGAALADFVQSRPRSLCLVFGGSLLIVVKSV